MSFFGYWIEDRRIPASDVKGILADFQIRKKQLDEIAKEVNENWPCVCEIRAGEYGNKPYFAAHLEPFSTELQKQHWSLEDKIISIIGVDSFSYYFLPKMEQSPFSPEIIIYTRD